MVKDGFAVGGERRHATSVRIDEQHDSHTLFDVPGSLQYQLATVLLTWRVDLDYEIWWGGRMVNIVAGGVNGQALVSIEAHVRNSSNSAENDPLFGECMAEAVRACVHLQTDDELALERSVLCCRRHLLADLPVASHLERGLRFGQRQKLLQGERPIRDRGGHPGPHAKFSLSCIRPKRVLSFE